MKIFENELWNCPLCGPPDPSTTIQDWKCPTCDDLLWIMADVDGNLFVLERVMAKDLEKDDLLLLWPPDDWTVIGIMDVKPQGDKIKIVLEDESDIIESPATFFNTIIGNWQHSED